MFLDTVLVVGEISDSNLGQLQFLTISEINMSKINKVSQALNSNFLINI